MKKTILCIALLSAYVGFAQTPIFTPAMPVAPDGIISSPFGEEAPNATDGDDMTKFLDFEWADGQAFIVDLQGATATAAIIGITTANDFPARDAMMFEVQGSSDGTTFISVGTGSVDCIDDRFETRMYDLGSPDAYDYYKIILTNPCDDTGGGGIPSMQVAEVQLYEQQIAGLNDNAFSKSISVSPNPSNGEFRVDTKSSATIELMEVYDLAGKRIVSSIQTNLNLKGIASGVYLIKISSDAGTAVKKLVIQ